MLTLPRPPMPRFRLYGGLGQFVQIARDVALGRMRPGEDCKRLEREIAALVGARHAVAAAKARVAIYLALRALDVKGKHVILSPYTISDVVNMVLCAGGIPLFADLEPDTCNIDAASVERLLAEGPAGAVMVTHLHGLACDMRRIVDLTRRHRVPLVEDAAQAFGARFEGRRVGTFGDAGIYSFGMYKNVNSYFGGMLVTSDTSLYQRVARETAGFPQQEVGYYLNKVASAAATELATFPLLFKSLTFWIFRHAELRDIAFLRNRVAVDIDPKAKTELPESYLRRLTDTQARLVLSQLPNLDANTAIRIEAARRYHAALRDVPEIVLSPLREDGSHIYTYFPIQVPQRERFVREMMRAGRDMAAQHLKNCADLPCFEEYARDCPNARRTAASVVLLPTYPGYGAREIDLTIGAVRRYFGR